MSLPGLRTVETDEILLPVDVYLPEPHDLHPTPAPEAGQTEDGLSFGARTGGEHPGRRHQNVGERLQDDRCRDVTAGSPITPPPSPPREDVAPDGHGPLDVQGRLHVDGPGRHDPHWRDDGGRGDRAGEGRDRSEATVAESRVAEAWIPEAGAETEADAAKPELCVGRLGAARGHREDDHRQKATEREAVREAGERNKSCRQENILRECRRSGLSPVGRLGSAGSGRQQSAARQWLPALAKSTGCNLTTASFRRRRTFRIRPA